MALRVLTESLFPDPVASASTYRATALARRRWMHQKHVFLSYPCPMCRNPQSVKPTPLPNLTRLIHYLRNRLEPYGEIRRGEGTEGVSISFFDGLFQTKSF